MNGTFRESGEPNPVALEIRRSPTIAATAAEPPVSGG
jgi:hypothetical protein